jgi:hypothetical protein
MHRLKLRGGTNRRIDEHFGGLGINPAVPPHGRTAGFAFSNLKLGTKEVRIRVFGSEQVEDFSFFINVPGFRADWQQVDPDTLYPEDEIVELRNEQELYDALMTLPCCTTRADGTGKGDPLNIVVIASDDDILGFIRAGWDETEVLTAASGWKTFKAFFGGEYKYSPMSALYVYGRPQDLSLQKARDTIHLRNHLRLWAAPWRYQGKRVWVGGISASTSPRAPGTSRRTRSTPTSTRRGPISPRIWRPHRRSRRWAWCRAWAPPLLRSPIAT